MRNPGPSRYSGDEVVDSWMKLAGSGQLPADHVVFLPNDII
ncbi:hypothetical protein ACN28I_19250 [Archangium gephyra]